ncbi:MAG: toxin-antitoxin system HicB family antitoxin [Actinobacteria bacterium]|nr:toxin-antitoxin system HicB family antitoxin [Actinomycetota bacterium]
MQLSSHLDALQSDLGALAAVGDAQAAEVAQRISAALESSLRLRMLEAVTEAAHELSSQLPSGRVEVRLAGGDPSLVYVEEAAAPGPAGGDEAYSARITLRLPEGLKATVEAVASRQGVSVNAWLVQVIGRSIDPRPPRGRRITGFARS